MKAANDAVRFLVELAVLAAIAYWGFHDHSSLAAKLVLGAGGPALVASIWAIWMAPQSDRRASERVRVVLEVAIFGSATAALALSIGATSAIIFAVLAVISALLDHTLARPRSPDQRDSLH